jgi:hypothetical protein
MKRGLLSSFTEEEKKNFPVMEPLSLVTIKAQLSPVRKLSPSAVHWSGRICVIPATRPKRTLWRMRRLKQWFKSQYHQEKRTQVLKTKTN